MRLALIVAMLLVATEARAEDGYVVDEEGRSMRVDFDPASRILVGGGAGLDEALAVTGYAELGVLHRHRLDFPEDGVSWKLHHTILSAQSQLGPGDPTVDAVLYRGRFMRWSEDAALVIPTSPPRSLPFPLDIGLVASFGELHYTGEAAEIGIADLALAVDPWRSASLASWLHIAVGPRYALWLNAAADAMTVDHLVAPFTAGSITVHHESDDGHHTVEASADGGATLRIDHGFSPHAAVAIHYETIILAVNDWPLSTYVEGSYAYRADPAPVRREHELGALAGLRLSLPTD